MTYTYLKLRLNMELEGKATEIQHEDLLFWVVYCKEYAGTSVYGMYIYLLQ